MTAPQTPASVEEPPIARAAAALTLAPRASEVLTSMTFSAPAERVWERLMFYEQIDARPPLHLRLLLPVPIRTEGAKSHVGDQALCLYRGGHLIKRVTRAERGRCYAFEVIEQQLTVGGGMRLSGGHYTLEELGPGATQVTIATRYLSPKRPRWLWGPIEAWVCHSFHRHILRAMRRDAELR